MCTWRRCTLTGWPAKSRGCCSCGSPLAHRYMTIDQHHTVLDKRGINLPRKTKRIFKTFAQTFKRTASWKCMLILVLLITFSIFNKSVVEDCCTPWGIKPLGKQCEEFKIWKGRERLHGKNIFIQSPIQYVPSAIEHCSKNPWVYCTAQKFNIQRHLSLPSWS